MHRLLFVLLLLVWAAVVLSHRPIDTSKTVGVDARRRPREVVDTSKIDARRRPREVVDISKIDTRRRPREVVDISKIDARRRAREVVDTSKIDARRRPREVVDTSRTGGVDWNNVVDIIFSLAKRDIVALGKDVIPMSEVRRNFTRKYGFLTLRGRFLANQGSLSNLTSFRRSGDVSAVRESPLVYTMVCTLTLDDLRVRYEHYELDVFGLGPRGHLEGTVASNTIRMTLTFSKVEDEGCLSALREVKLTELGGLRVDVSGLGNFDSLGSAIATWIVEQRRAEIGEGVERVLAREIRAALEDFQCDEYAALLML